MATREEIRDWINKYLTKQFICNSDELPDDECLSEAIELLGYLRSQGCVLRVDKELPCPECNGKKIIYGEPEKWETLHPCPTCEGNKFVAVEPLVEE